MILKFEPTLKDINVNPIEKPWFVKANLEDWTNWKSIPDILKYIEQQCNYDS